jgi:hypothetical protein
MKAIRAAPGNCNTFRKVSYGPVNAIRVNLCLAAVAVHNPLRAVPGTRAVRRLRFAARRTPESVKVALSVVACSTSAASSALRVPSPRKL